MKLKKKAKIAITLTIILLILGIGAFFGYKTFFKSSEVKETKVLDTIKKYGYSLKDSKSERYKKMFYELEAILKKENVDDEEYAKKISEMFIYDFYTLDTKTAKTDVGGTDFVYEKVLANFLENAEDTFYKYVESNIYNQRNQDLPTVDEITIDSVEETSFTYGDETDDKAYEVKVSWTYKDSGYDDYQKEATLIFVHDGEKLVLVELK